MLGTQRFQPSKSSVVRSARSLSSVWLSVTPRTVAHQAPLSMGFSRQDCWSGLPCLPLGDLPDPAIKPTSPALAGDSLPLSQQDAAEYTGEHPSAPKPCAKCPKWKVGWRMGEGNQHQMGLLEMVPVGFHSGSWFPRRFYMLKLGLEALWLVCRTRCSSVCHTYKCKMTLLVLEMQSCKLHFMGK